MANTCRDCGDPCGYFVQCRPCRLGGPDPSLATDLSGVGSGEGGRATKTGGVFSVGCACGAGVGEACDLGGAWEDVRVIVNEGRYVDTVHESRYRGGLPEVVDGGPLLDADRHTPMQRLGPVVLDFNDAMTKHGYVETRTRR